MSSRALARALGLAGVAAALLLADEAHVSQVHYMDEPLPSVLGYTEIVVVGQLADPPHRSETVRFPVQKPDGSEGEGSYGVFLYRVKITEVLHPPGAKAPAELIEVYSPELVEGLGSQLLYEVDGVMESPIYFQLEGGVYPAAPEHAEGAIYLLRTPPARGTPASQPAAWAAVYKAVEGAYPLAIGGGVLPLSKREEVLKSLATPPAPPSATPAP